MTKLYLLQYIAAARQPAVPSGHHSGCKLASFDSVTTFACSVNCTMWSPQARRAAEQVQMLPKPLPKAKVAVVGGGISGVLTAYLLEEAYDVTLFERQDRLGGHANTQEIQHNGQVLAMIDAGAEFLPSEKFYHNYFRLLDVLNIGLTESSASVTWFEPNKHGAKAVAVLPPPFLTGRLLQGWDDISKSIAFFRVLLRGKQLGNEADFTTSIDEQLSRMKFVDPELKKEFLLPLLNGIYPGPNMEEFKSCISSNIFSFSSELLTRPLSATSMHVKGGMRRAVATLAARLQSATVQVDTGITALELLDDGRYRVHDSRGVAGTFDKVVLAVGPEVAQILLQNVSVAQPIYEAIAGVRTYPTRVAIHSDTSFMPPRRKDWSAINVYPGEKGEVVTTSYRKSVLRTNVPVFKSWVTYTDRVPDKLYMLFEYHHPITDEAYFVAQEKLKAVQGTGNIWVAGMFTTGYNSHDSAVLSAMKVAQALAPASGRLLELQKRPSRPHRGMGCCA